MKRFLPILCCVLSTGAVHGQTVEQKQQTVALLRSLQGEDGGFRPNFGRDARPMATKSSLRASVAALRNEDGTYGKDDGITRSTGSAVAAVLRLHGNVAHRENVVRALKAGQRSDGGFGQEGKRGSDLDSSYRVVRAFVMLKEKPD